MAFLTELHSRGIAENAGGNKGWRLIPGSHAAKDFVRMNGYVEALPVIEPEHVRQIAAPDEGTCVLGDPCPDREAFLRGARGGRG